MSRTVALESKLDHAARTHALSSVVVADQHGLPVAAPNGAASVDEVAAVAVLRATGDARCGELVQDRKVKARKVNVGDQDVVIGAIGDTAICAAVFDELEDSVREALS